MKKLLPFLVIVTLGFYSGGEKVKNHSVLQTNDNPKSDVFMQGFYWNSTPGGIWWDSLAALTPRLASAGFSAVWIPSPAKGGGGANSMGYDVYDHYDFGEYHQKGSRETRFGSREELENMIATFHNAGIEVIADAVMRHMIGGEAEAPYQCIPENNGSPIVSDSAFLVFNYPSGSGRFKKGPAQFYPNSENCWVDPLFTNTDPIFRFGEWLDHNKQSVVDSLIVWGQYLRNELEFDGFRLDAVKSVDPAFIAEWLLATNGGGYAVAEYWGNITEIGSWLIQCQNVGGAKVSMFDFPLRYTLRDMCNNTSGTFDMRTLDGAGLINSGISGFDVSTFVENHDVDRIGWNDSVDTGHDPIFSNKEMAYAYTLMSEGRPCVFYKDYFEYGLAGKIDTLIWIRRNFVYGGTTKRDGLNPWYVGGDSQDGVAQDLYIARRDGGNGNPPVYLLINDNPTNWLGVWVDSDNPGETFRDYTGLAQDKTAEGDGRVELWAPPRGYAVYVPDLNSELNNPPVMNEIPDFTVYTNASFEYQLEFFDANGDNLDFEMTGNPAWLSINNTGKLSGAPSLEQTGVSNITISIEDPSGESVSDTFQLTVELNNPPQLDGIEDQTTVAAERYEFQTTASDPQNDSLVYILLQSPGWLKVGEASGLLSGTPAIEDTGSSPVLLQVADNKGGFDSTAFTMTVIENVDSSIGTYGRPVVDGTVTQSEVDWLEDWLVAVDDEDDSFWAPVTGEDNELYALYVTWDSDSLYIGVDYIINDDYNSLVIYIDARLEGGITDFNSLHGYAGDYPKNFTFDTGNGIEYFLAAYYIDAPVFYRCEGSTSFDITEEIHAERGDSADDMEFAVSWDDLYGLGEGLVPNGIELNLVALVAGGMNYGAGDSIPDNSDVDGDEGPDNLSNLITISPDQDSDGIPDPTIYITGIEIELSDQLPVDYSLKQNYPNPFNPTTKISFSIPKTGNVNLKIYDILGREVAVLVNKELSGGSYTFEFDASMLTSGVYFYRVETNSFIDVKKMLLLK